MAEDTKGLPGSRNRDIHQWHLKIALVIDGGRGREEIASKKKGG